MMYRSIVAVKLALAVFVFAIVPVGCSDRQPEGSTSFKPDRSGNETAEDYAFDGKPAGLEIL